MTAPEEHPPRLHKPRRANLRADPIDLPGHGADVAGDTAAVRLEECVEAIIHTVAREQLRDVVLVGHGMCSGDRGAGGGQPAVAPQADLPGHRRRRCPRASRSLHQQLRQPGIRRGFTTLSSCLSAISRQRSSAFRTPSSTATCATRWMPMEIVQILGFFGPSAHPPPEDGAVAGGASSRSAAFLP